MPGLLQNPLFLMGAGILANSDKPAGPAIGQGLLSGMGIHNQLQNQAANRAWREKQFGVQQNQWQQGFDATQAHRAALLAAQSQPKPFTLSPGQQRFGPDGKLTHNVPVQQNPTSSMQNYALAKQQGYKGSFFDYQAELKKSGATNVNVGGDNPFKVPPGYVLKDPNKPQLGVVPIPGGPKEEKFREKEMVFDGAEASLASYKQALDKSGTEIFPGSDQAKLKAAHTDVLMEMKELYNLGVLSGPDLDIMLGVLPDPTELKAGLLKTDRYKAGLPILEKKLKAARKRNAFINKSEYGGASSDDPLGIRR